MTTENIQTKKLIRGVKHPTEDELEIKVRDVLRFFYVNAAHQKNNFIMLAVLLLIQAVVIGGSIWFMKLAVDDFFQSRAILLLVIALFFATVVKSLIDFLYNWGHNLAVARIRDKVISRAYEDLLNCTLSVHLKERSSRKFAWILEDTNHFVDSSFGLLQIWIRQPLQMAGSIIAIAVIDWKLTLLGLMVVPLLAPCILYIRRKSNEFVSQRKILLGRLEEKIAETIYGIRIVKTFALEEREVDRVRGIISRQRRLNQTNAFYMGLMGPVSEALGLLGLMVVLLLGMHSIFENSAFTAGSFLAFLMAFFNIYRPLKDFSNGLLMYQLALDGGRRLILLQNKAQETVAFAGSRTIESIDQIEYRGVWFSYDDSAIDAAPVLRDLNFRINGGETVLLTGLSGAGKSTLCDLLFRLYLPQRGAIYVNNIPLGEIDRDSHRRLFAMCSQETIIFGETLLENIRIARQHASREDVIQAARVAHISESMLTRIDDVVGDRGVKLSGGERQRLALARAVLCKPKFMLLDEAMNSLDPDTEARVWKALKQYLPDCTFLVVSHRWMDLDQYDRVMVLVNGKLVEDSADSSILDRYQKALMTGSAPG
jgi:ABC-type multidrug transport system fused ATPase/permease subunit